jgi:CheY-like chemotaxis protein
MTLRPPLIVVEDSDEDFDTIEQAISEAGLSADVRRVLNGGDCLDLLRGATPVCPALVLMDLNTPATDGREALEAIKADPSLRHYPVVVFSTSSNPKDIALCYRAGANAYHVKPVRHAEHLAVVTALLTYWLGRVALPERRAG